MLCIEIIDVTDTFRSLQESSCFSCNYLTSRGSTYKTFLDKPPDHQRLRVFRSLCGVCSSICRAFTGLPIWFVKKTKTVRGAQGVWLAEFFMWIPTTEHVHTALTNLVSTSEFNVRGFWANLSSDATFYWFPVNVQCLSDWYEKYIVATWKWCRLEEGCEVDRSVTEGRLWSLVCQAAWCALWPQHHPH